MPDAKNDIFFMFMDEYISSVFIMNVSIFFITDINFKQNNNLLLCILLLLVQIKNMKLFINGMGLFTF